AMVNFYPGFSNMSSRALYFGELIEKKALERARCFVACSNWAAASAIRDYGISEKKVRVIHYYAGVELAPDKAVVRPAEPMDVCRLLFVGVEWERKGGEIAVDTVNMLNQLGIPGKLTIVSGKSIPERHKGNPFIEETGYLDRKTLEGRRRYDELFATAHFFILPTRAECLAQVFCDAAAFGLPALATDIGAEADVVQNDVNGYRLPLSAGGRDYAMKIAEIWRDENKYNAMCLNGRKLFDSRLALDVWRREMDQVVQYVLGKQ
ncbi:glycosyltransferase family 4 protein, partial [bacterium]|nr:glycosyltransferase family 4 protein [bacterium]